MTHAAPRSLHSAIEAEVLGLFVAHVQLVQVVAVDHRGRRAALVGDPLDVLTREYPQ
jgi:hypothetical protein